MVALQLTVHYLSWRYSTDFVVCISMFHHLCQFCNTSADSYLLSLVEQIIPIIYRTIILKDNRRYLKTLRNVFDYDNEISLRDE